MRKLILLAAAALSLSSSPAMAWGTNGHRVTGKIAQSYLTDEAKAGVTKILGVESIAEASTWPDFMRSAPSNFWEKGTPSWHYVTVPPGTIYSEASAPTAGDAVTALENFTRQVRDENLSIEERQLALRFVIHIVEDLHQPLHNGKGDDRGGNAVKVIFMEEDTNLHKVWDEDLIDHEQLSYSEMARWLQRRITQEQRLAWSDPNPQTWIAESIVMRDRIYAGIGPRDPEKIPNLSYSYVFKHKADIDLRLQQGGVRLATYLNVLFAN